MPRSLSRLFLLPPLRSLHHLRSCCRRARAAAGTHRRPRQSFPNRSRARTHRLAGAPASTSTSRRHERTIRSENQQLAFPAPPPATLPASPDRSAHPPCAAAAVVPATVTESGLRGASMSSRTSAPPRPPPRPGERCDATHRCLGGKAAPRPDAAASVAEGSTMKRTGDAGRGRPPSDTCRAYAPPPVLASIAVKLTRSLPPCESQRTMRVPATANVWPLRPDSPAPPWLPP